jgi:hypothetical protein
VLTETCMAADVTVPEAILQRFVAIYASSDAPAVA